MSSTILLKEPLRIGPMTHKSPSEGLETQPVKTLLKHHGMLTVSAIMNFKFCPYQFYLKYVKGLEAPVTASLISSRVLHEAFESLLRAEWELAAQFLDPLNISKLLKEYVRTGMSIFETVARTHIDGHLSHSSLFLKGLRYVFERLIWRRGEAWIEDLTKLSRRWGLTGEELAETFMPKRFFEVFVSSEELRLKGRIDILEEELPVEVKVGQASLTHSIQLALYALILESTYGVRVERAGLEYLYRPRRINVSISERLKAEAVSLLEQAAKTLDSGKPPSEKPLDNRCNSCNYWYTCMKNVKFSKT